MRARLILGFAFLLASGPLAGQPSGPAAPDTMVVPNGALRLRALLWMPAGTGPFPGVVFHPGAGCRMPPAVAETLGPLFVKHGYAFLFLSRRGDGLSADQGTCMAELLRRELAAKGEDARKRLQVVLLTTEQISDAMAGLTFLRSLTSVDARRIAVAGHSFGGQLSLLTAERDSTIQAAVAFAAGALSWDGSAELRKRLLAAAGRTAIPAMLVHAADDQAASSSYALAAELSRLGKPHVLKILPDHGHAAVYTAVAQWEHDVLEFLDRYLRR